MKMTEKEFLMNLLSIPSVNGENSEKDIAVYIQQFMVESGIDAQIQFIDEKHANVVAKLQENHQKSLFGMDIWIQFLW